MLKNFLKIAVRNLMRYKGYSVINIAGLAVGMACFMLILLFVGDEIGYDRYHAVADRIYRVNLEGRLAGQSVRTANTCAPMASTLKDEYPEVVESVRLYGASQPMLVSLADRQFNEERVIFTDSSFFDIFSIEVVRGDARTALAEPNSVVLTRSMAAKYFGDQDPMGNVLSFNNAMDLQVTAVSEDVPENTHFHYDFLISFSTLPWSSNTIWLQNNIHTYVVLQDGFPAQEFESKLPALVKKYVAPQIQQIMGMSYEQFIEGGGRYSYSLEPVQNIHLYSTVQDNIEPSSNPAYVTIFGAVAIFILVLACINFMNLATARSATRAKEVGIRKVVGSRRGQLVRQFLAEAGVLSGLAMVLAFGLICVVLPAFNTLSGKEFGLESVLNPLFLSALLGVTVLVSLLAGSYPAFFLAGFRPIDVLEGKFTRGMKSAWLRSTLVVLQFAISIALLIGTFVVGDQLDYIRNKQLGFDKEHLLSIKRAGALANRSNAFMEDLRGMPAVKSVASTWHLPGMALDDNVYNPQGAADVNGYIVSTMTVGYDVVETLRMQILAGRGFSREFATDSSGYILNQAAVEKFGWGSEADALGKTIVAPDPMGEEVGQVIGVVRDYNYKSLHVAVEPALMRLRPFARLILVRLDGESLNASIAQIGSKWEQYANEQPFEYSFLDDDFDALYRSEERVQGLFSIFSGLGILIACLGLFGLASFATEQRTKEIGVRKVLGASVPEIVLLLSREFTKLVAIAFVLAAPVAHFAMSRWLEGFAYQAGVNLWLFASTGLLAFLIAYLTVGYQSIRAALANPAKALQYQ